MAKLYTREEARRRRVRYQIFAGMFDFLAIIAGIVVVIGCLMLFSSLYKWVTAECQLSFCTLYKIFMDAIIIPE